MHVVIYQANLAFKWGNSSSLFGLISEGIIRISINWIIDKRKILKDKERD